MTKQYCVTYDLRKYKDYPRLWDELKRLGGKRLLGSVWWVSSTEPVAALTRRLVAHIDSDDNLLVVEVAEWDASSNMKHAA